MQLYIVPGDELPIYRQIMRQITDALAGGRLGFGDKLPSQRELAEQLVISPLTVKKAYDELEHQGVISTQRGRGTFVSASSEAIDPKKQSQRLRDAVRRVLSEAYLGGVDFSDVLNVLHEVHEELVSERDRHGAARAPDQEVPHEDR